MTRARRSGATRAALVTVLALVVGGCAAAPEQDTERDDATRRDAGETSITSELVLEGDHVDGAGNRARQPQLVADDDVARDAATPVRDAVAAMADDEPWPAPELLDDGTVDDGVDPFEAASGFVTTQPVPIEDDPGTTRELDVAATSLRRIDVDTWQRWMASARRNPYVDATDLVTPSIVRLHVERCGGARTAASGVVLAPETVVTTVHVVESLARRVRVQAAAAGADGQPGPRLPAIVRYLDVDDDVAVLKVPGLRTAPLGMHAPASADPTFGFLYGVAQGGRAGTMRRIPVLAAQVEQTATLEQPDGFANQISDRSFLPFMGAIAAGSSGGVIAATNDPALVGGWGFHGLVRARVPFRQETGGVAVPARVVRDALTASAALDPWYEHRAGACPQWRR